MANRLGSASREGALVLMATGTLGPVRQLPLQVNRLWINGVVPIAVEIVAADVDGIDLGVGDFDSSRIGVLVEFAAYL